MPQRKLNPCAKVIVLYFSNPVRIISDSVLLNGKKQMRQALQPAAYLPVTTLKSDKSAYLVRIIFLLSDSLQSQSPANCQGFENFDQNLISFTLLLQFIIGSRL